MEQDTYPVRANQILVTLDGNKITPIYTESTGVMTVQASSLKTGMHTIVITAVNDAGYRSRICHMFRVGDAAATTTRFVDTASSWAKDYIEQLAERGIVSGSSSNGNLYYNPSSNLTQIGRAHV